MSLTSTVRGERPSAITFHRQSRSDTMPRNFPVLVTTGKQPLWKKPATRPRSAQAERSTVDSVSQLALGASIGIAVMGRRTAVWKAALWGGIAGTLPDLDVLLEIKEHHIKGRGALGSEAAANLYGLEILGKSIETNKRNFTRFLVLKQRKDPLPFEKGIINKASISFLASHKPGSLAKALTIMGEFGMNLTKIQSLPILGKEWTYFMYADLEFDHLTQFEEMVKVLEPVVFEFVILGEYTQAIKIN